MTKEALIDLRGQIISIIRSKVARTIPDAPCWLEECGTWIVARGRVKTLGNFMEIFDRESPGLLQINPFDQRKEMGLHQMRRLEHLCGVAGYEYESLPSYHQGNPAPPGVDAGEANRLCYESFSRHCDESDRLQKEFGGEAMLKSFEDRFAEHQMAYLTAGILRELKEGEKRMTFRTAKEMLTFVRDPAYDQLLDHHDTVIMRSFDGTFAMDVVAKSEEVAA